MKLPGGSRVGVCRTIDEDCELRLELCNYPRQGFQSRSRNIVFGPL